ncbi:Ig-like domain-containing protein [Pseudomonas moraviensis]|uniref:Ig-like domain-containing protein n=1 Tax=Pseudomonas moraviensis TaxID=321662 RepID=UPI002093A689|nr:Ig-like domain-containing protein [Pseudomonas moraviensis]UST60380.1 Ig-like domain-containing protein [Pseudomonas moraviensis]
MSSPQKPLLLAELGIPGRSKDPVSKDPDVWGINIAAALDNFPYHGLRCEAGPWGNMASGDRLTIFWGTGHNVLTQTVLKDEVDTQLRMFVPSRHMVDGEFAVSYSVKPLGGTDQPSEVMQVLVKLTRPGGHDNNGDDGHSRLIMIIAQEILDGGIHEGNVAAGVDISIGKADGTPPYPFAAAGDICRVSWGGIFVLSAPLTQDQAEGTAPIIVKIKEDIIRDAGDAGGPGIPGVAVVFEVYDKVFNRSEDWSPEQRVVVAVHATRLGAPLLKEAVNDVLDVDQLGDADGTVQVVATDKANFKIGDIPFIKIKGTPVEGPPIDLEIEGLPLISVPSVVETKAPNAVLRQLAKSQITVSYRLKKADGSADLISNGQFIRAIGEVQRLAEPIMLDEDSGALNPPLDVVLMDIPFDTSFVEGYVLQPIMLGTTSGLKPYLPALPTRPITHNDIVAAKPLSYSIDGNHLTPVNGGTAEFYYQLLIPSAAFAKLDAYQASHAIRESIHTDILRVGKPRRELPEPVVAGVVDGVLPADTPGTTATIIYTETVKGDEAFMFWVGSITGEYPDSIKLNEFTAGKEIPFTIPAAMIKDNEGGTVVARYEIKRADGRTSYAEPLEFRVGVALDLKEPKIKQAPNDTSLDPLEAQNALTSVINYDGMLVGDRIIVRLTGAPGTPAAGSHTTEPWPVTTVGPQEIPLAVSVLAFNLAKSITLDYTVTRGTQDPKESRIRALAVSPIAQSDLPRPLIVQASEQGEGPELDVSQLTTNATLRANSYPHIALKQYVWLKAKGTLKGGGDYLKTFWQPPGSHVSATWINQGFYAQNGFPLPDLQSLEDGRDLELEFKAGFGGSQVETEAVTFALRTYRIKAYENVVPTLGSVTGSPSGDEIPHGGLTVETAVTLSGVAAKGQKVEIFDGTVSKGQATAHATTGVWTLLVSALAVAAHSFTVKALYGSGAVSAARTLTVTPIVVPTLSNVLDDKNVEIPEGQTTVSTALKLIGTASKGQRVEIFEGNGPSHTSKGVATASTATGMWELPITVAVGARRLYAGSLYTSSPQWSNVRTLTVTEATAPTLDNVLDDKGVVVPKNTNTLSTSLTLKGSASIGQKVEIFDGTTSIGEVTATSGIWEKLITGLSLTSHTFTAKAVYGSGAVSTAWKVTVQAFTLDRSPMNLNGLCLILDPSNSPRWKKSGAVEPGTTQTRRPTVAAEPVSYVSSNPSIASVDSSGKVTSVNKGKSIITVTDARLNSGTYEVNVTNVHRITIRRGTVTSAQGNAWIASVGGINGGEYVMNTLQRLCSNDGELGTQYTGSTTRFYAVESHSSQAYLMGIDSGGDVSRNSVVAMIPV